VVHDAFLAVTSYVHFRWSLDREVPEAPSPRWLREEREELVGSLSQLSERLRPLRHLLETLTPMID
jgi:hypothetical protein